MSQVADPNGVELKQYLNDLGHVLSFNHLTFSSRFALVSVVFCFVSQVHDLAFALRNYL